VFKQGKGGKEHSAGTLVTAQEKKRSSYLSKQRKKTRGDPRVGQSGARLKPNQGEEESQGTQRETITGGKGMVDPSQGSIKQLDDDMGDTRVFAQEGRKRLRRLWKSKSKKGGERAGFNGKARHQCPPAKTSLRLESSAGRTT